MIRRSLLILFVALWIATLVTGCERSSSQSTSNSTNSSTSGGAVPLARDQGGAAGLKLIPVDISSTSAGGGWKDYQVYVAIENPGPAVVDLYHVFDTGKVQTQEGSAYNVDITDFSGEARVWLPPLFRVSGISFHFRAGESTHPTTVQFSKFGTVDLTSVQKPIYPTDAPPASLHKLSDPLEVKNAKITFAHIQKAPVVGIDVVIENIDKGQSNQDAIPACIAIGNDGVPHSLELKEALAIGPGQTVKKTFFFSGDLKPEELGSTIMLCYNNYNQKTGEGTVEMFRLG